VANGLHNDDKKTLIVVFAKVGVDLKWGTKYQKSAGSYVSNAINSLTSGWWSQHYVTARRVL